jgi:hypothetical protein
MQTAERQIRDEMAITHVIMLEMRPQDAPAELANVGDNKACAKLGPRNKVGGFGIVDHSVEVGG